MGLYSLLATELTCNYLVVVSGILSLLSSISWVVFTSSVSSSELSPEEPDELLPDEVFSKVSLTPD